MNSSLHNIELSQFLAVRMAQHFTKKYCFIKKQFRQKSKMFEFFKS